jgi:hypothetical protein
METIIFNYDDRERVIYNANGDMEHFAIGECRVVDLNAMTHTYIVRGMKNGDMLHIVADTPANNPTLQAIFALQRELHQKDYSALLTSVTALIEHDFRTRRPSRQEIRFLLAAKVREAITNPPAYAAQSGDVEPPKISTDNATSEPPKISTDNATSEPPKTVDVAEQFNAVTTQVRSTHTRNKHQSFRR